MSHSYNKQKKKRRVSKPKHGHSLMKHRRRLSQKDKQKLHHAFLDVLSNRGK